MTPQEARAIAAGLIGAAQKAEAEYRDVILQSDLDVFSDALDEERAKVKAIIAAALASGQPQIAIDDN